MKKQIRLAYIIYIFFIFGFIWQISACKDPKPQTVIPAHTTGVTTGVITGGQVAPQTKNFITWKGVLDLNGVENYHSLLRAQGRCDPCSWKNAGAYSCNRFNSGALLEVIFEKNELPSPITLRIMPVYRGTGWNAHFSAGFCSAAHPNPTAPLVYKGTAKYTNNYRGFQARFHNTAQAFTGRAGLGYVIVKSEYGLPEDQRDLELDFYYGGSASDNNEIGTAQLTHPNSESTSSSLSR